MMGWDTDGDATKLGLTPWFLVVPYAWVNDDDTKRAYDSSDDAYRVFRGCSKAGIRLMTGTTS